MPYNCYNHPRRTNIVTERDMPDGFGDDGRLQYRTIRTEWLTMQCGHQQAETDPECTGCIWRHDGNPTD